MNLAGSIAIGASSENFGHSCLPSPRFAQTSNRSIKKGLYDCIFVRLRLSRAGFERTKTFVDKHICTSNPSFTAVAGEQSRRLEQPNSLASFIARDPTPQSRILPTQTPYACIYQFGNSCRFIPRYPRWLASTRIWVQK